MRCVGIGRAMFVALGLFAASAMANAQEQRWTHYGIRPLAMGNAFVAVADDYNALFYNPAGLARLKDWSGELLNPYAEVSQNTISAAKSVQSLVNANSSDISSVLNFLQSNTGKNEHFDLGIVPHLVMPGFGFGVAVDLNADMVIHRDIAADVNVGPQIIAPVDFAGNFLENRLSIGGGAKLVATGGVNHEFSINDLQALTANSNSAGSTSPKINDFVQGGYGVGFDGGFLFTPVQTMSPTLGMSITDLGGTPYIGKANINGAATAVPPARLPSVNVGVSIKPIETHSMYVLAAADVDSANQPMHYSKKFNLGLEWGYGSIIKVETGLHQGELSAGFDFEIFLFSLRFVTYSEQLGSFAGQDDNLRDRRYALQLKLLI